MLPANNTSDRPAGLPSYPVGHQMITSHEEAILQFQLMTQGVLAGMSWDNVAVCGGSVNIILDSTLNPSDFPASDIDLFVYGENAQIRRDTVRRVLGHFQGLSRRRKFFAVNQSVIGIFMEDCPAVFQVICGQSTTILDILHYFDLDHLRMAFDGQEFYLTVEAAEALRTKSSYIRSYGTNLKRIWKSCVRGYNIVGDINLAQQCMRYIRADRETQHSIESVIYSSDQYHVETLMNKYGHLLHKYYYPRMGEPVEKVKYEISIHYPFRADGIYTSAEELLPANNEEPSKVLLDGDFKSGIGNTYLGRFLSIDPEKIALLPIPVPTGRHNGRRPCKWRIHYMVPTSVGNYSCNITCCTPLGIVSGINQYAQLVYWQLQIDNHAFIQYWKNITQQVRDKIEVHPDFERWTRSLTTPTFVPRIRQNRNLLEVKVNYHRVKIFLSDGTQLGRELNRDVIFGSIHNGSRMKLDVTISQCCAGFGARNEYYFTYEASNIYLWTDREVRSRFVVNQTVPSNPEPPVQWNPAAQPIWDAADDSLPNSEEEASEEEASEEEASEEEASEELPPVVTHGQPSSYWNVDNDSEPGLEEGDEPLPLAELNLDSDDFLPPLVDTDEPPAIILNVYNH